MNLVDYGYIPSRYMLDYVLEDDCVPARVVAVHKERYALICEQRECFGRLKSSIYYCQGQEEFPTTGDFVIIKSSQSGDSQIIKTLPRISKFLRSDFSGRTAEFSNAVIEQVVAANFNYVFIISSLNNDFNIKRIMRYLTQARQSGAKPVIILTKADLCPNYETILDETKKVATDVPIHAISSHSGYGMSKLDEYLKPGSTVVLLGMSGVGKSSLVNALMKKEVMEVKSIREDDSRGRHTTTHRELFMLPSGAMVIDTPGMREMGIVGADEGISEGFCDIESLFEECKFSNCQHQSEPGCAVIKALADGSLAKQQWEIYLSQKRENAFVGDKSRYLIEKRAKYKMKTMQNKQMKGKYK